MARTILEAMHMLESNSDTVVESNQVESSRAEPSRVASTVTHESSSRRTAALLDELLVHSIKLRDLYKSARWQTADIQFSGLRALFDDHYKEQLRLVDVLLDRLRLLGGAGRVLGGLLVQGTQFSSVPRGKALLIRLLRDLLDAHDAVLTAARSGANGDEYANSASSRDFAVGQVALVNDTQFQSISDQLVARSDRRRVIEARQDGLDAHG
jgi:starvation-inducible DNA-binding protein